MGVIPERIEYKNCSRERATAFAELIANRNVAKRVTFTAASEKSHFDRYGFVSKGRKVSVVYDVKAKMLSVTAGEEVSAQLKKLFEASAEKSSKQDEKTPTPTKQAQAVKKVKTVIKKQPPLKKEKETKVQAEETPNDSGGLSLKKYTQERYGVLIARLKKEKKKYKLSNETVLDKDKPTELISYVVSGGGVKLKLRYMPKKQVLQLQGKHGALFSELRLLLSEQSDYRAAVDAHIEQEKTTTNTSAKVERQLKKLMPSAYEFLSEQSKIDFTIGIIEIINSKSEHYDYSMLLLPPFRGLERLIFDLQRAKSVVVKMIGQAYEKEDGQYVLKASYRRKINSVVYAEVMASLYREYYEKRNYYAHSDGLGGDIRVLQRREQAIAIFNSMLAKIEYNCKKLTEIGFKMQ
jgi:hypothetical protein